MGSFERNIQFLEKKEVTRGKIWWVRWVSERWYLFCG